jgi:molybdopterin synthase catalytic subunit
VTVRAWITRDVLDVHQVLAAVGSPADGAAVLFVGTVRAENDGRPVSGMRYEAYAEMAEAVLCDIASAAAARIDSDRVAVVHRIGELAIGDASVAIAVSAPHRAEAFDAARFVIEQIKQRLPVWKHEHYTGGDSRWLAGSVPDATHD